MKNFYQQDCVFDLRHLETEEIVVKLVEVCLYFTDEEGYTIQIIVKKEEEIE